MTAPARITQDDWNRATKSVVRAGLKNARIIGDLQNQTIEIIIGGPSLAQDDWTDDDT